MTWTKPSCLSWFLISGKPLQSQRSKSTKNNTWRASTGTREKWVSWRCMVTSTMQTVSSVNQMELPMSDPVLRTLGNSQRLFIHKFLKVEMTIFKALKTLMINIQTTKLTLRIKFNSVHFKISAIWKGTLFWKLNGINSRKLSKHNTTQKSSRAWKNPLWTS